MNDRLMTYSGWLQETRKDHSSKVYAEYQQYAIAWEQRHGQPDTRAMKETKALGER